jgi:hypothetical protein
LITGVTLDLDNFSQLSADFNESDESKNAHRHDNLLKLFLATIGTGITLAQTGLANKDSELGAFRVKSILDSNVVITPYRSIKLDFLLQLDYCLSKKKYPYAVFLNVECEEKCDAGIFNKDFNYVTQIYNKYHLTFRDKVKVYQIIIFGPNIKPAVRQTDLGSIHYSPSIIYLQPLVNVSLVHSLTKKIKSSQEGSLLEMIALARIPEMYCFSPSITANCLHVGINENLFPEEMCKIFLGNFKNYIKQSKNPEILEQIEKESDMSLVHSLIKEGVWAAAHADGIQEGLQEGLQKGHQEGLQKGKELTIIELSKNLLKKGWTRQAICEALNVTESWLINLDKNINGYLTVNLPFMFTYLKLMSFI